MPAGGLLDDKRNVRAAIETSHANSTYDVDDVIHCCVANMPELSRSPQVIY